MKLAENVALSLSTLATLDERIFVLDADLADSDGAFHFANAHPERFFMAGIAEQNMVSVAAGMAETGLRPWVFSFAAFLCFRAYDQTRVCVSQARQPVTLVGSHSGGLSGRNGKSHTALNDLSLMLSLPGVQVWAPADSADVEFACREIMAGDSAAYMRLPRYDFSIDHILPGVAGTTRWLRPPQAVTLVTTGLATGWGLDVAQRLEREGVNVGVFHCLRLSPLPDLREELSGISCLVVLEDHYAHGGLGSLVRNLRLSTKIVEYCWPDSFLGKSGSDEDVLNSCGLSSQQIASSLKLLLTNSLSSSQEEKNGLDCCKLV